MSTIKFDEETDYTDGTVGLPLIDSPKMSVRNLNVSYNDKKAIYDLSLDIGKHEVIAMIGPSGCGKSTFLRCLNRMNDPMVS